MIKESCRPFDGHSAAMEHLRASEAFGRGQFLRALAYGDHIVALRPEEAWGWRFRGECLLALGRCAEAAACLERAVALRGCGTEDTFLWLAIALQRSGDKEAAVATLEAFLRCAHSSAELAAKARGALDRLSATG